MTTMWTCMRKEHLCISKWKMYHLLRICWNLCPENWAKNQSFANCQSWLASRYIWSISTCGQRSLLSKMGSDRPVSHLEPTLWRFEFPFIQGRFRRFFFRVPIDRSIAWPWLTGSLFIWKFQFWCQLTKLSNWFHKISLDFT